jgi:hypothetical protein
MDRDDWDSESAAKNQMLEGSRRRRGIVTDKSTLTPIALAEAPLDRLTKSDEWNFFVKILQNHLVVAKANMEAVEQLERDSTDFSPAPMASRKCAVREWMSRIQTLEEMLDLPKILIEDAGKAKEMLREAEDHGQET